MLKEDKTKQKKSTDHKKAYDMLPQTSLECLKMYKISNKKTGGWN